MVASPLPHREHRHLLQFYVAPKLGYGAGLTWSGSLILLGMAMQILLPDVSVVVRLVCSLPLLLVGNLLLLVQGYNLRPEPARGKRTWEKTTPERFARLRELEQEVRQWDESFTDLTCPSGVVALLVMAAAVGLVAMVLSQSAAASDWGPVFVADAIVLLAPHWITGTRRGWRPVALRQTVDALQQAMAVIHTFPSPHCEIQPLFEVAEKGDRRMPTNARVFVRFPDGPTALLGLQFQVTLNNVQGTNYPYLYAVLVADKQLQLIDVYLDAIRQQIATVDRTARGERKRGRLTIESSREADVDVIVIRQATTKTSGYHTKPAAIRRIAQAAWHAALVTMPQ